MIDKEKINRMIRRIMMMHVGRENAITSAAIAKIIGNYFEDATHQGTRESIKECLEESVLPIGANSKGYFLISSDEEYREYLDNLERRIMGIKKRARLVMEAWKDVKAKRSGYNYEQMSLEELAEL